MREVPPVKYGLEIQEELVAAFPERYFRPPYVGSRGWVGMRLGDEVDWDEVAVVCLEAYRLIAPARLRRRLDDA